MVLVESVDIGKDRGNYPQIVSGLVSSSDNIPLTTVTHAMAEVVNILSWDTENNWM